MQNPREVDATKYWEEISPIYEKLRKIEFGQPLKWHNRLVRIALIFAISCIFIELVIGMTQITDISHFLFKLLFTAIFLALLFTCICYLIVDKKIDENKSPDLWIQAIKEYKNKHDDEFRTESEILLCLYEHYKLPKKTIKRNRIVKIILFIIICFICPYIVSLIILPNMNILCNIFNMLVAYFFTKYVDVVEEAILKISSNNILFSRMKKEAPIAMIKQMRLQKVK
ncbi:MAG: hypothetical protein K6B41_03865 [Butyrivibrio sp.]|nr:hypothetical protein [Butyrivibrio sp.]